MAVDNEAAAAVTGAEVALGPGETNPVFQLLRSSFPSVSFRSGSLRAQDWAIVPPDALVEVCRFLRDDARTDFKMLVDVTAVDLLPRNPRWEVVYSVLSLTRNERYRLKVELLDGDAPAVPTVTTVWPAANFYEREIFDLMGIRFAEHPNLRRILLPDDWVGHPLRYDHPLGGEEVSFTS